MLQFFFFILVFICAAWPVQLIKCSCIAQKALLIQRTVSDDILSAEEHKLMSCDVTGFSRMCCCTVV